MKKILIVFSYTESSYRAAMDALLTVMHGGAKNHHADIALYHRFDVPAMPQDVIYSLNQVYENVIDLESFRMMSAMTGSSPVPASFSRIEPFIQRYKCACFVDHGSLPLRPDWIEELIRLWDFYGQHAVGSWTPRSSYGNPTDCIGKMHPNAMYSADFICHFSRHSFDSCDANWSEHNAMMMRDFGWQGTRAIQIAEGVLSPDVINHKRDSGCVLLHRTI